MNRKWRLIVPALLAVFALSLPLAAEGGGSTGSGGGAGAGERIVSGDVVGTGVVSNGTHGAVGDRRAAVVQSDNALRRDYRGYSSRLSVIDKRIDENVAGQRYTAAEAARHRADLNAIRARFRNKNGHTRRLNAAQRARLDSDIRAQEQSITAANQQ